ncbi:hypothetical protein NSND_62944 [Nitrospira sp. ND1]|nr:hypothetical protein NSND_62944 [Nitrospira sp. ND1]
MKCADSIDPTITGPTGDRHVLKAGFPKKSLAESFKSIGWESSDKFKDADAMWNQFLFFWCGLIRKVLGECCFPSGLGSRFLNGFEDVQGINCG